MNEFHHKFYAIFIIKKNKVFQCPIEKTVRIHLFPFINQDPLLTHQILLKRLRKEIVFVVFSPAKLCELCPMRVGRYVVSSGIKHLDIANIIRSSKLNVWDNYKQLCFEYESDSSDNQINSYWLNTHFCFSNLYMKLRIYLVPWWLRKIKCDGN